MENFNKLALNWDDEPRRIERANVIAGEIIRQIGDLQQMNGFEYGCGTGLLSVNLQPHLKRIWLGDSSEGMLEVLQKKIEKYEMTNMTPLLIDLTTGELPLLKFDLIYTSMTLHHIVDTNSILKTFNALLNAQGYLCIADLDKEDGTFHEQGFIGHFGFDRTALSEVLNSTGFRVISNALCYDNIKTNAEGEEKIYPIFLMICQKE